MKKVLLLTTLVALLVSFIAVPIASGNNGLAKGYYIGEGHTDYPGQGLAKGHAKHGCDPTCPFCGGYHCIPPCDGTGPGGGGGI